MESLKSKINGYRRKEREKIALMLAFSITIVITIIWFILLTHRFSHSNEIFLQEKQNFQIFIQKIKGQISTIKGENIFYTNTCNRSPADERTENLEKSSDSKGLTKEMLSLKKSI